MTGQWRRRVPQLCVEPQAPPRLFFPWGIIGSPLPSRAGQPGGVLALNPALSQTSGFSVSYRLHLCVCNLVIPHARSLCAQRSQGPSGWQGPAVYKVREQHPALWGITFIHQGGSTQRRAFGGDGIVSMYWHGKLLSRALEDGCEGVSQESLSQPCLCGVGRGALRQRVPWPGLGLRQSAGPRLLGGALKSSGLKAMADLRSIFQECLWVDEA